MTAVAQPAARQFPPAVESLLEVWADRFDLIRQYGEAREAAQVARAKYDGGKADGERMEACRLALQRVSRRLDAAREVPGKLLGLTGAHPPELSAALSSAVGRVDACRAELSGASAWVESARVDFESVSNRLEKENALLPSHATVRESLPIGHSLYHTASDLEAKKFHLKRAEEKLAGIVLELDEAERDRDEAETALLAWFGVDPDDLHAHRERCEPAGFVSNGKPYARTVLGRTVHFNPFTPFVCDDAAEVRNLREFCGPHKYLREVPPHYRTRTLTVADEPRSIWDRLGLKLPAWMGGRYVPPSI